MNRHGLLMVGNFLSDNIGIRCVCEELAPRLKARGWSVTTTSRIPARLPRMLDMLYTAWCKRNHYRIAQVDLYSGPSFVWAEAVAAMLTALRRPFVLTVHGGRLPDFARRWTSRVRRLLNSAAAVSVPSRFLLERIAPYRSDLVHLNNGLEIAHYPCRTRTQAAPRLVWLRSFHRIYNPSLAVRAAALLSREFPALTLRMAGPDRGDGSFGAARDEAARLGIADRVEFVGRVPKCDVPLLLAESDIFVNTTNVDNAPVCVVEAMAAGLCVVSTNVGGVPYLVRDGHDGLLVPPDDPAELAAAVRRVLTEPDLAASLSRNGRSAAQSYDWSAVLPQWESLFKAIA